MSVLDRLGSAIAFPSPRQALPCSPRATTTVGDAGATQDRFHDTGAQMDCRERRNLFARPAGMGGAGPSLISDYSSIIPH